jgi:hypothetical protein
VDNDDESGTGGSHTYRVSHFSPTDFLERRRFRSDPGQQMCLAAASKFRRCRNQAMQTREDLGENGIF